MDLLVITAASVKGTTAAGVDITVKLDGQPASLEFSSVQLPPSPRPLKVEITLTPSVPHLFGVTGTFEYLGEGKLLPLDEGAKAPHFRPVRVASIEGKSAVMSLIGYVSRLRDVTTQAVRQLGSAPDRRLDDVELTKTGRLDPINHVRTIGSPPLESGQLVFDAAETIAPLADLMILELAADPAPKLLGVTCPRRLIPSGQVENIAPLPVLIYFHSTAGQNFPEFYGGQYPFSWDFLQYGLFKYLFYEPGSEPLTRWGGKGMPYQMSRARKHAVYVLPLNRPFSEVGVMIDATSMQEVLEEVIALLCRRKGLFIEPALGRVALAGFSSGNLLVTRFLQKNANTPFLSDVLKEVYNFDIPAARMPNFANAASAWLSAGDGADKMLRMYTQQDHAQFRQLLGVASTPTAPFIVDDSTGNRTAACLPAPTWFPLASGQMQSQFDFQVVHQLIAETCLTDAMRRSGFPSAP